MPHPDLKIPGQRLSLFASLGAGVLLLYLLFPTIFVVPIVRVFGPYDKAPPQVQGAVHTFFLPIRYLSESIPAYRLLLSKEAELTGVR